MKTKFTLSLTLLSLLTSVMLTAQVPTRTGWWTFDNAIDLLGATIGSPLTLVGEDAAVNGPVTGNNAIQIGTGSYLVMDHGIEAPVEEYSLQIDFSVPQLDVWNAFFQTTVDNSDDAECFINTSNRIGAWRYGYSENDSVEIDTWYRMIVTVKNGEFYRIYVDGKLWVPGVAQDSNSRDALQNQLLVFADDDGEDNTILCSELAIWDVALTADQVAELGDATTSTIGIEQKTATTSLLGKNYPNPVTGLTTFNYQVNNPGNVSFSIVDYAGREVRQMNAGQKMNGSYTLELSADDLNNGIYFIRMNSGDGTAVQKFIVNK